MCLPKAQQPDITNVITKLFVELGFYLLLKRRKKGLTPKWGTSHLVELKELLQEYPELVEEAGKLYEQHLFGETFMNCLHVTEGSQEFLQYLSTHYTLALATGVHPKLLKERIMPQFHIPQVFTQIMTGYDLADHTKGKPDPYIAQTIMKEQGFLPEETIMVGDAKNDVLMAQHAGITPIVVLTGHLTRQEAEKLGVKYIIEDVTKLETVLTQL